MLENSVAIDAGIEIAETVPAVDQRNADRATPDLGAFEYGATAPEVVYPEYPVLEDTTSPPDTNQGGTAIFAIEESQEDLNLYPNPNNGTFKLDMSMATATIEVIDISGRIVFSTLLSSGSSITLPAESNGIYFVKAIGVDGSVTVKRVMVNK